ncbi:MAG: hypothetical protein IJ397_02715 [Lachnospiraceae bacterium]|nr:hypothetical protein [Lachnospiraceae bacterium]
MPWCPNCKTEYREGIEKCADCGSTLVKSLNEEDRVEESCSLLFGDEKHVKMIEDHLRKEGFSSVFSTKAQHIQLKGEDADQSNKYELFVSDEEREGAVKCAAEFMRSTNPQALEAAQNPDSPRVVTRKAAPAKEFKTVEEKRSELKSSGIMLTAFGVAGIVFMVLVILGVVPMNFSGFNAIIAYSIMGIFFGALLVSGIVSFVSLKNTGSEGETEKAKLKELDEWCAANLTKEIVEKNVPGDVDEDEQVYFERFDYMKNSILGAFSDLGDDYAEYYTEQKYSEYFE